MLLVLQTFSTSFALDSSHFTINRITAPYFIVDGNFPTTVTRCYVGFEVINNSNSGTTYQNLIFSIPTIGTSIAGQNYTILAPLSKSINVGTLAPGASKVCYFFVNYPANTSAIASFNTVLSDATANSKNQTFSIYNRSSISANAGGISTNSFSNQDLLGGILTDTVTYTVGNVRNGDESDFQVAATASFDATKLELISTRVIESTVSGVNVGSTDSLYFITGNGGVGATVKVLWTFRIVGYGFTTYLLPLAGSTSGATNYKYALNTSLGVGTPVTVSISANPLTIEKFSDAEIYCPGVNTNAKFTVRIHNSGAFPVSVNTISDTLPAGFSFSSIDLSSDVTSLNSTIVPSNGTTGAISFEGGVSSGGNTSYVIPAGGNLNLIYNATVPLSPAFNLVSGVSASVGTTSIGNAKDTLSVTCSVPVSLLNFNATRNEGNALLKWSTSKETNTSHFLIQHSTDGSSWTTIGSEYAAGNSDVRRDYSFQHILPTGRTHYYRLKEMFIDNSFLYSSVARLTSTSVNMIRVYPTWVSQSFINIDAAIPISVLITDATGKLIRSEKLSAGNNRIGLSGLSKGTYFIRSGNETIRFFLN